MKLRLRRPLRCPRCDGNFDALEVSTWGHGRQPADNPISPFICTWCASLLLIDVSEKRLYVPPPKVLPIMQANPVLWDAITEAQRKVATVPGRRPVLR